MNSPSLRDELARLEAKGDLLRLDRPAPLAAVPGLLAYTDGGPALRSPVEGFGLDVVGNICNSRQRMAESIGLSEPQLAGAITASIASPLAPVAVADAPFKERSGNVDLTSLPIPTFFEQESGPYITAGIIVVRHPDTGAANLSFARFKVLGPDRAMLGVSPNHHLGRLAALAAARNVELPIAVALGNHPAVMLAACLYLGFGDDELECAGAMLGVPIEVTSAESAELFVPSGAEIVLEGLVDGNQRIEEGRVSEYHGHYHEYGPGLAVRFVRQSQRNDAFYQVVLPGLFREHALLGGVSIAAGLERHLRTIAPNLVAVAVPEAAAGRTCAVLALDEVRPGQARQLMMAAMAAVPLIKQVVVVDADVDPWNTEQVEWARLSRSRFERDLLVIPGARTDRSEPLNDAGVITKLGIDATVRRDDRPAGSDLAVVPAESLSAASELLASVGRSPSTLPQTLGRAVGNVT